MRTLIIVASCVLAAELAFIAYRVHTRPRPVGLTEPPPYSGFLVIAEPPPKPPASHRAPDGRLPMSCPYLPPLNEQETAALLKLSRTAAKTR
jgi:hypothetical protein